MRLTADQYAELQGRRTSPTVRAELADARCALMAADGTVDADALELVQPEPPARRKSSRPPKPGERDVLAACLLMLRMHPKVAWAHRMNVGKFRVVDGAGERWIRAAFKGCSDIIGQMRDGRFIACETKAPGNHPTPEQQAFLDHVQRHGGVAFVARSIDDVTQAMAAV